jgi:succinate-acetate transporter protein
MLDLRKVYTQFNLTIYRFLTKLLRVTPVEYPFHFHTSVLVSCLNIGVHFFQPITDLAHFGYPALKTIAGYELMSRALSAWYVMAHLIYVDVFGRDVLPVGKPWIN